MPTNYEEAKKNVRMAWQDFVDMYSECVSRMGRRRVLTDIFLHSPRIVFMAIQKSRENLKNKS